MSPVELKGWFACQVTKGAFSLAVVSADSKDEVKRKMGILAEGHEIIQLTWRAVQELTGCIVPSTQNSDDFACGRLTFVHKGKYITFWQEIEVR